MQRGGSPCPYDRVLCTRLGAAAAKLILKDDYGYMVGMINGQTQKVPLQEVAGKLKMVQPDAAIISEAKQIGISFSASLYILSWKALHLLWTSRLLLLQES